MGSSSYHTPYIPNQTLMYQKFGYTIPNNTPITNTVNPTPNTIHTIDPNSNKSQ